MIVVYNQKATNAQLRNRVEAAVVESIWQVFEESPAVPERVAWAKASLGTEASLAMAWLGPVCGNATVQAADFNPTDGDIRYIVNSIRDKVAV